MQSVTRPQVLGRCRRIGLQAALAAMLAGCATLPSSGPTGGQIQKSARAFADSDNRIQLVEVTDFASLPGLPSRPAVFAPDYPAPPTDLLGPGDLIDVSIYESGVTLFGNTMGRSAAAATTMSPGISTSAQVEVIPPLRIDDNGNIRLPYVGQIHAAGNTAQTLASAIRQAYRGLSQNPQVLVSLRESVTNSVVIGGEVVKSGRLVLPTNHVTLSEMVALAGGYRGETKDMAVRVQRLGSNAEYRLADVLSGPEEDVQVFPGDKISVVRIPRTYSVMGAPGRVEQIPFSGSGVTLAEALATAGGAQPNLGDPAAIFVFRFIRTAENEDQPVVYHLNMMNAGSYFLAQRFAMRDKDVLYIGNARANQPSKLIQVISQLFAPIVTVRDIARSVGN